MGGELPLTRAPRVHVRLAHAGGDRRSVAIARMIVLAFDTATPRTAVALQLDEAEPPSEAVHDPEPGERPGHATRLLPLAAGLLGDAGLGFPDVELLGVGVGTGDVHRPAHRRGDRPRARAGGRDGPGRRVLAGGSRGRRRGARRARGRRRPPRRGVRGGLPRRRAGPGARPRSRPGRWSGWRPRRAAGPGWPRETGRYASGTRWNAQEPRSCRISTPPIASLPRRPAAWPRAAGAGPREDVLPVYVRAPDAVMVRRP